MSRREKILKVAYEVTKLAGSMGIPVIIDAVIILTFGLSRMEFTFSLSIKASKNWETQLLLLQTL
jgi:hypothetical protein